MVPFLVGLLFHVVIAYGLWMMITPFIDQYFQGISKKLDYRRSIKNRVISKQQHSAKERGRTKSSYAFIRHMEDLLYLSKKNYQPGASVILFFIGTGFLMIAVLLITLLTLRELPLHLTFTNSLLTKDSAMEGEQPVQSIWRISLLLSVISGIIPYLKLRYEYLQRKNKASYDLLEVVKIYAKFGYLNVSGALNKTANILIPDNVLQRPLFILAEVFASYTDEYELNEGTKQFSSTIDTTFANIFVSNLIFAEKESNHQLSGALMELTQSMEEQRDTIMKVKTKNRDAIQLGLFGNLLVIIMSMSTFIYLLTPAIFFKLQFQTSTGLSFLAVIISSLFISFAIGIILAKPRLDYH